MWSGGHVFDLTQPVVLSRSNGVGAIFMRLGNASSSRGLPVHPTPHTLPEAPPAPACSGPSRSTRTAEWFLASGSCKSAVRSEDAGIVEAVGSLLSASRCDQADLYLPVVLNGDSKP